jgi:hypothetical protein
LKSRKFNLKISALQSMIIGSSLVVGAQALAGGYITTDRAKMSLVVVNTDGSEPTAWSTFAPFTKQ